ncbi:DUF4239 domain-containing protein [Allorhizocola rhizosphaerae]|uniref:bestrophin-like domain n=1 Tax=Allorhizocola rhizosphaerae TaxID=1872709 RepID=UPI0013C36A25|nr:DUF4239 domain-containing protein [Allorhizocola rhizosphaerae]
MFRQVLPVLMASGASVIGFLVVGRCVPARWRVADTDAASTLYSTIATIYAIIVALAAVAVWEPRSAAFQNTEREASALIEVHWAARTLEPPDRAEVQGLIIEYAREAATSEFDGLRHRRVPSRKVEEAFNRMRAKAESAADPDSNLTKRLNELADARRARITVADDGMPLPMWPILIGGGVIIIAFLYLFGLARTFPNGLMLFVVGGMIGLVLTVLYHLEFPYSRGLAVTSDALQDALFRLANPVQI